MALNGRRSLTLTEWQSLVTLAEWQAFTLFCHSFLRFAIKQSLIALPLRAKPVCHSMPFLLRFDKGQSPHQQKISNLSTKQTIVCSPPPTLLAPRSRQQRVARLVLWRRGVPHRQNLQMRSAGSCAASFGVGQTRPSRPRPRGGVRLPAPIQTLTLCVYPHRDMCQTTKGSVYYDLRQ